MTEPIYMADVGWEAIIYIIAVFLWMIGNLFSKSKRSKQRRGGVPFPRPDETSAEKEIREFLETIAGQPSIEIEDEPPPVKPAPPPPPRPAKPGMRQRPAPMPVFAPVRKVAVPVIESEAIDLEAIARELRDNAPSMASSMSTSLSSKGSLFKTTGLTMPSLRYALSSSRPRPALPAITSEELRDPRHLRNLMAAKMILGPPRAFDPFDPSGASPNR